MSRAPLSSAIAVSVTGDATGASFTGVMSSDAVEDDVSEPSDAV